MRSTFTHTLARLLVAGSLFIGAVPHAAAAASAPELDATALLARGRTWTDIRVPYSQLGYEDGYRRDCSGFVSMVWDLPENLTTWRIPLVAEPITKDELRAGDVLLDYTSGSKHVVLFERWANAEKTAYWTLEQTGQDGVDSAIRRVVPYPYRVNKTHYKPYRYTGMSEYWQQMPVSYLQPVSGYEGPVSTPATVTAQAAEEATAAAEAARVAEERRAEAVAALEETVTTQAEDAAAQATAHARSAARAAAAADRIAAELLARAEREAAAKADADRAAARAEAARKAAAQQAAAERKAAAAAYKAGYAAAEKAAAAAEAEREIRAAARREARRLAEEAASQAASTPVAAPVLGVRQWSPMQVFGAR